MYKTKEGFTLIELIIVIAVIGILAAAVFVAVDPAKRIGDANNAQRWSDVTAIADAILTYTVDNSGSLPDGAGSIGVDNIDPNTPVLIMGKNESASANTGYCAATTTLDMKDISGGITPTYLPTMPSDPTIVSATSSIGYYIIYDNSSGRIKVGACTTYNGAEIYVQR